MFVLLVTDVFEFLHLGVVTVLRQTAESLRQLEGTETLVQSSHSLQSRSQDTGPTQPPSLGNLKRITTEPCPTRPSSLNVKQTLFQSREFQIFIEFLLWLTFQNAPSRPLWPWWRHFRCISVCIGLNLQTTLPN